MMSFLKQHKLRIIYYVLYIPLYFTLVIGASYFLPKVFSFDSDLTIVTVFYSFIIMPFITWLFYPFFIWRDFGPLLKILTFIIVTIFIILFIFITTKPLINITTHTELLLYFPLMIFEIATYILNIFYSSKKHDKDSVENTYSKIDKND